MAVFPQAPGHPDYSSTGASKFAPQIWATRFIVNFYKATVFADICNTEYEGQIKAFGDTVIMRTIPTIVSKKYKKGMKLVYDAVEAPAITMVIDQGEYFGFPVDYIDRRQADVKWVEAWSQDAASNQKIAIDSQVINNIYTDVATTNKGSQAGAASQSYDMGATSAPFAFTKTNIIDKIVDCGSVLDEANAPEDGRWMVLPTHIMGLLKKSDIKDASLTGDGESTLRNGRVGKVDTFTIYKSNNYTPVSDSGFSCYHILYGHRMATTFAAQLTQVETLKNPDAFGDLIRGLTVYGYKVQKGAGLGDLYGYKAA